MGIVLTVMASLMLTWKIAKSLKVLAMTNALDKLGDKLSEPERAEWNAAFDIACLSTSARTLPSVRPTG